MIIYIVRLGVILSLLFVSVRHGAAQCRIATPPDRPAPALGDPLARLLAQPGRCPDSVQALVARIDAAGLLIRRAMVANRGRHNPDFGSFSFFEEVTGRLAGAAASGASTIEPGHFFFGHFTGRAAGPGGPEVVLDQRPFAGRLLVEAIAWDASRGLYHFYELIGGGPGGARGRARWLYRGDSLDALADNRNLYRTPAPGEAKFGRRMRCSACHNSGGPIMKELAAPHNDWWSAMRPLPFGPNRPSPGLMDWMQRLSDASVFAASVRSGIETLAASPAYRRAASARSLQERLRPLFCTVEINLESDVAPLDGPNARVQVPAAFWVDGWLQKALRLQPTAASVDKATYRGWLRAFNVRFPEAFPQTGRRDADHALLMPVKGFSDQLAIEALVGDRVVDRAFALSVRQVDAARPLLSESRCRLLAAVPSEATPDWRDAFRARLASQAATDRAAAQLLAALDGVPDEAQLRGQLAQRLAQPPATADFRALIARRRAVLAAELSQNPLGQILEPGFRVVFPTASADPAGAL